MLMSLVLSFLIQAGRHKTLKDLLIAISPLIGRKRALSVLLDKKVKIGAISLIGMESCLFASDSLFLPAELVLSARVVPKVKRKFSFCVQMNAPIKPFRKPANVRKRLNFARYMQRELVLKGLWRKVYEPVKCEGLGILGEKS